VSPRAALAAAACLCAGGAPDAAAQCTMNIGSGSGMSFGAIGPQGGDSTATMNLDCTPGTGDSIVRVCLSIDSPTSGNVDRRQMQGPGARMDYNLYSDAARTQVWGSAYSGSTKPPTLDFPLVGGNIHTTFTIYGRVPAGQTGLPAGDYVDAYPPGSISYASVTFTSVPVSCASLAKNKYNDLLNFRVSTKLAAGCSVSATTVDFGQRGNLSSDVAANGTVTANCPSGINYSLRMDAGTNAASTVAQRLMTRSGGSDTIAYNLYTSPGYASVWGDGTVGAIVSGTGIGGNQTYTVFGRLPKQATPRPGMYADTITLTITY